MADETTTAPLVLVAEDEEGVRAMLGIALRAAGFESILCSDGEEALKQLQDGLEPDIVLMDVRMPRMGGVELARRVRLEDRWDLIPLVAMSAYSDDLQEHEIKAAGADAFLPKPFTIADLRSMLYSLLPRDRRPS
ncbi:MAG: response regulator [Dehalococcoidia bacterium]|nr:response regulator [Dehalococcoidia bacterium]